MALKSTVKFKTDEKVEYEGRFLGFLKDDEFNALVQNADELAGKIDSKETQSLLKLARSVTDLPGSRFVVAIRKINGENLISKRLFVSPRLDLITEVQGNHVSIQLADSSEFIQIEERDA